MGVLNFCDPCGALPVRQVKGQLDKLFVNKTLPKQDRCVICLRFFAPQLKDRKTKPKGNQTGQKDAVKISVKREKIDSNDDGNLNPLTKNKKSRTRLETGTIKPFHFLGSDDENEGIDVLFTAMNVSDDSDSSSSTPGRKPVLTAVKSNKSKSSICKKKKMKGKEVKKMGSKKKKNKGPEIITDEEFVNRRSLDPKVLNMVDKDTNEGLKTKALKCKECSVSFCHLQRFITHVNTHLDDKLDVPFPYICPICSRNERTYMDLDRHMIMHKKERPYSCDWPGCTWKFTCRRYLTKHIMRHQGHKSYCGRRPSTKVRKFKCSQCEYNACSKQILEFHENTHTNARPFKCDHCNRSFNCPRNKQIHERNMHSNSKDNHFMCELCGYSSFFKADLKKHQRIHSGEKPFECEHCEYKSSRGDNLRKHLRVHTGEKKHKCGHCDLMFHSQQSCKKHEAAVHIIKKREPAFPISLHALDGKDVQLKESTNCTPGVSSHDMSNPPNLNLQGAQNPHVSIIHNVPEKESDHSTSSLNMTNRPCHPQNLPMINNPAMIGSRDRIYDLPRSGEHEPQLRTHQGPMESEEQESPLRLHQESARTEEHRPEFNRQQGPLQNEGHVTPLRISEEQRPILRPHQEPRPSEGHGDPAPLRLVTQSEGQRRLLSPHQEQLQNEGHGHATPLTPEGAIQSDGHGPQLRPNQGLVHSEGPGAPVRPLQ